MTLTCAFLISIGKPASTVGTARSWIQGHLDRLKLLLGAMMRCPLLSIAHHTLLFPRSLFKCEVTSRLRLLCSLKAPLLNVGIIPPEVNGYLLLAPRLATLDTHLRLFASASIQLPERIQRDMSCQAIVSPRELTIP